MSKLKTITKSDALKTALAVAGSCKSEPKRFGLIYAECSRRYEGTTKWHWLSWDITGENFQVSGSRQQHDDGRIRDTGVLMVENNDAYAAWLISHFPEIAARVDRLRPLIPLLAGRIISSINLQKGVVA